MLVDPFLCFLDFLLIFTSFLHYFDRKDDFNQQTQHVPILNLSRKENCDFGDHSLCLDSLLWS